MAGLASPCSNGPLSPLCLNSPGTAERGGSTAAADQAMVLAAFALDPELEELLMGSAHSDEPTGE